MHSQRGDSSVAIVIAENLRYWGENEDGVTPFDSLRSLTSTLLSAGRAGGVGEEPHLRF